MRASHVARKLKLGVLLPLLLIGTAACNPSLPEGDSPKAKLYRQRCSGCHRLYAPGVLTAAMWRFMVARMEEEFRRRGVRPLTPYEKKAILSYLEKHSAQGS